MAGVVSVVLGWDTDSVWSEAGTASEAAGVGVGGAAPGSGISKPWVNVDVSPMMPAIATIRIRLIDIDEVPLSNFAYI